MKLFTAFVASLAMLAAATPARAQAAPASSWTPWLGCWDLVRENVRADAGATTPGAGEPRVCVTAAGDRAATLTTTVQGQPALEQTIVADGAEHAIAESGCRGNQRAEWSRDNLRLYARAELTCAADATPRSVSGLALIAADGTWLDIQAVRLGTRESTRVRRYRRAPGQAAAVSPYAVAARFTLDDVKEAAGKVSPRVIEAALVETQAGFDLTARQMTELSEANVPASILDLLVALSYPKQFVVERASRPEPPLLADDPFLLGWAFGAPFLAYGDGFYYPNYYYSPFGYSYAGRDFGLYGPGFGAYGYYGPGYFVGDSGGGGGVSEPQPSGNGRVVNGLGYTRVRSREPEPAQQAAGSSGRSRPASAGDSSGGGSSASSSGGSASPQGYSGGGGGDSGRTAQPR